MHFLFWTGLAVAVAYFPLTRRPQSWPRSIVKTVPLVLFAVAAALTGAPWLLVAGLALSALGDFALFLVLLANTVATEFWLAPHTGSLRWPVRFYVLVITAMGLSALTLPLGLAPLGAALFIVSDTLLAIDLFRLKPGDPRRTAVRPLPKPRCKG